MVVCVGGREKSRLRERERERERMRETRVQSDEDIYKKNPKREKQVNLDKEYERVFARER